MTTLPLPAQAAISDTSENGPINSTSALVVHTSNERTTLLSQLFRNHYVVDSGASDYMIGSKTIFSLTKIVVLI